MAEKLYGIYAGTVVNANDPEGRARLQVVLQGRSSSGWARPCRPYSDSATPPIGTEVWVMFEDGDPLYPVWMGCDK